VSKPTAILDIDGTLVDTNYRHAIGMGGDQLVAALTSEDFDAEHGEDVRAAEKARSPC
jgi:phosphoglycolate phosphatase-like HAD superfamily hydrolase